MPSDGSAGRVTHTGWRGAALAEGTLDERDWTSPVVELPFAATELIPSWNADTPAGSWVEVFLRVCSASDRSDWSPWFELGRWARDLPADDAAVPARTSVPGQRTAYGVVEVDTLLAGERGGFTAWQLRVRRHGEASLRYAATVASAGSPAASVTASRPGRAAGTLLDVPPLSQQLHRGHYPQWDGGGASWCAATSLAMVLRFHRRGPSEQDLAWVEHPHDRDDRDVDHAARGTFDAAYGGCGNWAFGAAYAGSFGLDAFLTRLRDLTEAEALLAQGLPLVASVRHGEGELTGAGYTTAGHLLVITGITAEGDVACNDPASHGVPDNAQVPVVYDRAEFERAWLLGSGGLVYVVAPPD